MFAKLRAFKNINVYRVYIDQNLPLNIFSLHSKARKTLRLAATAAFLKPLEKTLKYLEETKIEKTRFFLFPYVATLCDHAPNHPLIYV